MRRLRLWIPTIGVILFGYSAAFALPKYLHYDLSLAAIAAGTGAAMVLIVGKARVVMLAAGSFLAIGAYTGALVTESGYCFFLSLAAAAILGLAFGLLLGSQVVRFDGHEGALVTLAFQVVVTLVLREASWSGGASGLIVQRPNVPLVNVSSDAGYLQYVAVVVGLVVLFLSVVINGPAGVALSAIADEPVAAEAFGVRIARHRLAAFAAGTACLSILGALMGPLLGIIDPTQFGVYDSVMILSYPVLGGLEVLGGGLIAGEFVSYLPSVLRDLNEYKDIVFALLVLILLAVLPSGAAGGVQRLRSFLGTRLGWQRRMTDLAGPGLASEAQFPLHGLYVERPANGPYGDRLGDVLLRTDGLGVQFGGVRAIADLTVEVPPGVISGIIGPNGAGKTTFINVCAGQVQPTKGLVTFKGANLASYDRSERLNFGLTRTFQRAAVFGRLTVLENFQIGEGRHSVSWAYGQGVRDAFVRNSDRGQVRRQVAIQLGLGSQQGTRAADLSLGGKRLVGIGRALSSGPILIILDEPVSGLSADEVDEVGVLLESLVNDFGVTVLVIEHNIGFVRRFATHLMVLDEGHLLAEGPTSTVLVSPAVRLAYFGELG